MSSKIRIIFIILSVIFIIFLCRICSFYIDVNHASVKDDHDPQTNTVNVLSGDLYSFGENGFYGVKNSSGKIIIEARWNTINQIGDERFIVSIFTSKGARYGIIDISENVIVPFVYTDITDYNEEFLAGVSSDGKYVLFDCSGEVLINEEWDSFHKNYEKSSLGATGNYIQADKGNSTCRIRLREDGNLIMTDIHMARDILGHERTINAVNHSGILRISDTFRIYNEITDRSVEYIEALFSSDTASVKDMAWSDEYREIQPEGMNIRGSELIYCTDPQPEVNDDESGRMIYTCSLSAFYISHDNIQWDGSFTDSENLAVFDITFRKNQDGNLAVSKVKVRKGDPSEIVIPEEYIKVPETEPEVTDALVQEAGNDM